MAGERKPMTFRFDVELMGRVDAVRGSVSRTAWVEAACLARLPGGGGPDPVRVAEPRAVPRPAKPLRLAAAGGALTSAQAKVGVKPIDWKSARAGEGS